MKQIKLVYLLLLIGQLINAQNYIPSPQTWDIMANGRVPIKYFTGALNYSIPIYELKDKDFRIPISINYNSAGFIPSKPSSIIGLNWSLDIGGVITRKVNGCADEKQALEEGTINFENGFWYGHNKWNILCDNEELYKLHNPGQFSYINGGSIYGFRIMGASTSVHYEVAQDEFEFNFMGHHGKFMCDLNGNPTVYDCDESSSYKIDMARFTPLNNYGVFTSMDESQIVISTNDGYQYFFGGSKNNKELCCPSANNVYGNPTVNRGNAFYSSWYLSKIIAPNGRTVEFKYMEYGSNYHPLSTISYVGEDVSSYDDYVYPSQAQTTNDDFKFWIATSIKMYNNFVNTLETGDQFNWQKTISGTGGYKTARQYMKTTYLEKILIDNVEMANISYLQKSARDLPDEIYSYKNLKVEKISIKNGQTVLKNATFSYIYGSNRMFLDYVDIEGEGKYNFTYDNINNLPSANTTNIDHWGFWSQGTGEDAMGVIVAADDISGDEIYIKRSTTNINGREPHQSNLLTQAGMLTYIKYPTGGGTSIAYEPHTYLQMVDRRSDYYFMPKLYTYNQTKDFYNAMLLKKATPDSYVKYEEIPLVAGGVRVKTIEDYDGNKSVNKREFIYKTDFDGFDSGILMYFPRYRKYITWANGQSGSIESFNSSGISTNCFCEHICYSTVIEKDFNGYIKYNFTNYSSDPDTEGQYVSATFDVRPLPLSINLFRDPNSCSYRRGRLLSQTIFDKDKNPVKIKEYEYSPLNESEFITSVKTSENAFYSYKNYTSKSPLVKIKERDYSQNGNGFIDAEYLYEYNNKGLKKKETLMVDSKEIEENITLYPSDIESSLYSSMASKNMLNYPIVQTRYKNGAIVGGILNTYKALGSTSYVLDATYQLNCAEPLSSITPFDGSSTSLDSHYGNAKIQFVTYDEYGNPQYIIYDDGRKIVYLWSYHAQYPVAKIEGLSYSEVSDILNPGLISYISTNYVPDNNGILARLYTNSALQAKNALISTYTYCPMVGMLTSTDPRGLTTTYSYDSYNRLISITGPDGYIIKKFDYHIAQ